MASVTNGKPAETEPLGTDTPPDENRKPLRTRGERWARLCKDLTARAEDLRQLRDSLTPRTAELDKRSLQLDQQATLINQKGSFTEGIAHAQQLIEGSCSLLLLTGDRIYAARDRLGRTPLVVGRKADALAVTLETCALPNLRKQFFD